MTGFLGGFRKRAAEAVARQEAAFARGKVAGRQVVDDQGGLVVDAGHVIDDAVIERAAACGKLHAVAAAAVTAAAQDLKEKAAETFERTAEGKEAHALGSVDDYAEARAYIGRRAGVDVTDIRGSVIVPAGKEIGEDDVRAARQAGQLSALIYAAQQPAPPVEGAAPLAPGVEGAAPSAPAVATERHPPAEPEPPPPPRRTLPLLEPPDRGDGEH